MDGMKEMVKALLRVAVAPLLRGDGRRLRGLVLFLVREYARRAGAEDALRLLLQLDQDLGSMHGSLAAKAEGGIHPKHRLTRYHEYFIENVRDGQRILDVGCGNGTLAHAVASHRNVDVLGVDIQPLNIECANRLYSDPRLKFVVGDALVDLPQERFDVVILSNVLEHLGGRAAFMKRLAEVARPEYFLIRVPLFDRDWRVPLKKELGLEWRLDATHETEYTVESLAAELKDAGLEMASYTIAWGEIWARVTHAA